VNGAAGPGPSANGAAGLPGLEVDGLTVRFGGHVAVDGLSFTAPRGRITGLIGPNGAGKTTTFNVCSGLLEPAAGRVRFDGRDITRLAPPARARLGLGRTFQRMELFGSLTVAENIAVGREAGLAGASALRQVVRRPGERATVRAAVERALEVCGLSALAGRRADALSTGQRRLVELARAHACDFSLLLLDEPSSGLDHHETEAFGAVLAAMVAERGTGLLLVEHDMALVMGICDHLYVLDFGTLIFEGPPDAVRRSDVVRAAYLGSDAGVDAAGAGVR
jgi:ABC-type branched-subunit amino acid transport system ATPase component